MFGMSYVWYVICLVCNMFGMLYVWYAICLVCYMFGMSYVWYDEVVESLSIFKNKIKTI